MVAFLKWVTLGVVILIIIRHLLAYRSAKHKVDLFLTGLYVVLAGLLVAWLLVHSQI